MASVTAVSSKGLHRRLGPGAALSFLMLLATAGPSAGGQGRVPRRPPEPFHVFVHTSDPVDAALKAQLEEAIPMVRKRVERRRRWFQLAETSEAADITLRVVNYRTGQYRNLMQDGPYGDPLQGREFHFLDAVVQSGGVRTRLSGLDEREIGTGPSLRNAASHLAEELEPFSKDNYSTLSQLRTRAREKEPRGDGAPPRARNASPERP